MTQGPWSAMCEAVQEIARDAQHAAGCPDAEDGSCSCHVGMLESALAGCSNPREADLAGEALSVIEQINSLDIPLEAHRIAEVILRRSGRM